MRDYYRLLTGVDREIGALKEALRQRGLADRTVIIVTGDNGFALGDRGLADKWFMWEEDIRVPTVVFDPGLEKKQRGRRVPALALNVDFAPTLLDLAGLPAPASMQGRSLVPWLRGESPAEWRTEFLLRTRHPPGHDPAVRRRAHRPLEIHPLDRQQPAVEELYDLAFDPFGETNLAGSPAHAAQLEELRAATTRHADALQ